MIRIHRQVVEDIPMLDTASPPNNNPFCSKKPSHSRQGIGDPTFQPRSLKSKSSQSTGGAGKERLAQSLHSRSFFTHGNSLGPKLRPGLPWSYASPSKALSSILQREHGLLSASHGKAICTGSRSSANNSAASLELYISNLRKLQPDKYDFQDLSKLLRTRTTIHEADAEEQVILKERVVREIDSETLARVKDAWKSSHLDKMLIEKFNIPIRIKDLKTLSKSQWLNDEIINFYFSLLAERRNEGGKGIQVHAFNTFFYTKLKESGYSGVRKWLKRKKVELMSLKMILIPVHLGIHWTFASIDVPQRQFGYYDSMSGGAKEIFQALRDYVSQEASDVNLEEWSEYYPRRLSPQQSNGYDCGVFACETARCVSQSVPLIFGQSDMQSIRMQMAAEILRGRLY